MSPLDGSGPRQGRIPDRVVDAVKAAMLGHAATIAQAAIGGPPNRHTRNKPEWRWGTKNGMRVFVSGPRVGACADFDGTWKGDLIELVRLKRNLDFPGAIKWIGDLVGIAVDGELPPETEEARRARETEAAKRRAEQDAKRDADETRRSASAVRLWDASTPVAGTVGERYLIETRAIPRPAQGWPDAVRFHAGSRSLILAGTDSDGAVRFVQRVRLTVEGRKIAGGGAHPVKETNGVMSGAFVRIPGAAAGPLLMAEGPETGISLWAATGHETRLSIGPITRHEPQIGRRIVVCRDDSKLAKPEDVANGKLTSDQVFDAAVSKWIRTGADIAVATPWADRRHDESDFNDTIQAGGVDAVRVRVEAALGWPQAIVRVPVEEGRTRTLAAAAYFYQQLREYDARWKRAEAAELDRLTRITDAEFGPEIQAWRQALADADAASAEVRRAAAVEPATNDSRWLADVAIDEAKAARRRSNEASQAVPDEHRAAYYKKRNEDRAVAEAVGRRAAGAYPVHAIRVDVGVGKSHANLKEIVKLVRELREAGDKRAVVVAIPAHTLGDEQADKLAKDANAAGISAGVWRSRRAPDPNHHDYRDASIEKANKTQMCLDYDAVMDANEALATVQTSVCRNPKTGDQCGHFDKCPFQKQKSAKHDVWFVAHELLFSGKPAEIGPIAAVVVDESAWQDGLFGVESPNRLLLSALLSEDATVPNSRFDTEQLRSTRRTLSEVLATMEIPDDGDARLPVLKAAVLAAGIDATGADAAYGFEWKRKVDAKIHPGMPAKARKDAVQQVIHNKVVAKLASIWKAVAHLVDDKGPDRSGWLSLGMAKTAEGAAPAIYIKGRKDVHKSWHVPTLLMDATMQPDIVRLLWPTMELTADVRVKTPHQHITQVVDRSYALSQLRRDSGFRDVHGILCRHARQYAPRTVLAVVQIEIEEKLLEMGNLPANLKLAHHNNIAGRDEWGDVASLVVVGRTEPSPRAAEWQAEAMTGVAIDPIPGYYEKAPAWREMADGTFKRAEATRHPDPIAEAVRWHIAVGELVQILGRPRGVNRTAANPVDVLILTDVPLPLPIERLIRAAAVEASHDDIMIAAGYACLSGAAEAASAYPELWGKKGAPATRKATQQAFAAGRGEVGDKIGFLASNANRVSYYGTMPEGGKCPPPLLTVEFQVAGKGREPTLVCYDPAGITDIEAWLTERVGPMAWIGERPGLAAVLNPIEAMAARGIVIGGYHAFKLYPGMFLSEAAAKKAIQRVTKGKDISGLPCMTAVPFRIRYQVAGAGQRAALAFVSAERLATVQDDMEAALGPLAPFEVVELPAAAPPAPPIPPSATSKEQPMHAEAWGRGCAIQGGLAA